MNNAERQRRYRARHLTEGNAARINAVVSPHAKAALTRLARHYGVTERATLETLIGDAESALVDSMDQSSMKFYFK